MLCSLDGRGLWARAPLQRAVSSPSIGSSTWACLRVEHNCSASPPRAANGGMLHGGLGTVGSLHHQHPVTEGRIAKQLKNLTSLGSTLSFLSITGRRPCSAHVVGLSGCITSIGQFAPSSACINNVSHRPGNSTKTTFATARNTFTNFLSPFPPRLDNVQLNRPWKPINMTPALNERTGCHDKIHKGPDLATNHKHKHILWLATMYSFTCRTSLGCLFVP